MRDATPLTDLRIRKAKPDKHRAYRLHDGGGLALWISPSGVKSWQLRYRLHGREQTAVLGKLDALTLAEARAKAEEARQRVAAGEQLTALKREQKARKQADRANTFGVVAQAWVDSEAREQQWTADYRGEVEASLANHLSELDDDPLAKVTLPRIAPLLTAVKRSAPNMHPKVRSRLNAILWFAVENGFIAANPLPPLRRRKGPARRKHYPAVVTREGVGEILRAARGADVGRGVQRGHQLLAFTAQRVGEIVAAQWAEVDLKAGTWAIPRERMKRKDAERGPHQVPLAPRLLAAMREWRQADVKAAIYVCPSPHGETHVTREALEKFYRRTLGLSGKHGPHSWRSAFSTICREAGKDSDTIEAQLDHSVGTKVAAAYDRAKRLELRRDLMTWYEATLIAARDGASVTPIKAKA
jgi:integrase